MCFLAWAQAMSVQEFAATLALGEHTVRGYRNSFLEGFDTMPGVGPGACSPRELVTPVVLLPTAVLRCGCEYAPRLEPLLVRREAP
jgi:hypothetical protein